MKNDDLNLEAKKIRSIISVMILRGQLLWCGAALVACSLPAFSDSLALSKKERWLVVASTRDVDSAIGIAGLYAEQEPRVVSASNGWYAVVMGPYKAKRVRDLRDQFVSLPQDAMLTRGATYQSTVWSSKTHGGTALEPVETGKAISFTAGATEIEIKMPSFGDGLADSTVIKGRSGGREIFSFKAGEPGDAAGFAQAGVIRLDSQTPEPQFVFTRYSGGAHCCTRTFILTRPNGAESWIMVDAGELDGEGYGFIDLDGDSVYELAQIDNNFLYSFDSYANSFAPVVYRKLSGGALEDVSGKPVALHALKQDIAALEFTTRLDPSVWNSNGFLAAWVASKIRLGSGEEAWATMLENFDRKSEFAQKQCLVQYEAEACPANLVKDIPFPQALARFLEVSGYGPLPDSANRSLE
jgi:serine protease Do